MLSTSNKQVLSYYSRDFNKAASSKGDDWPLEQKFQRSGRMRLLLIYSSGRSKLFSVPYYYRTQACWDAIVALNASDGIWRCGRQSVSDSLTHGAEPFLRSRQLCSYSRTFQHFMESEDSLPCSQEPSTGPYPEPDQSKPYHPMLCFQDPFCVRQSQGFIALTGPDLI
jgi:hypothetical protein